MTACLLTSVIVVGVSHNDAASSWKIQPSVILAICSGTSSVLLSTALEAGVAVRFWLAALNRRPLTQLHYIWDHGRGLGLFSAVRAGSTARVVAILATGACVLQFLASPLLQRSTYQTIHDGITYESMSIDIAKRIPEGWFGPRSASGEGLFEFRNGLQELQEWWRKDPILTHNEAGYSCNGTCDTYIQGAGFSYHCWTMREPLDVSTPDSDNASVFAVSLTRKQNTTNDPFLWLRTRYLSDVDEKCMGTMQTETCYLKAATVQYPVTIQNTTVSLRGGELLPMATVSSYTSPGDSPDAPIGTPAGPLLSLRTFVLNVVYTDSIKLFDARVNRSTYMTSGPLGDIFFISPDHNPDPSPPTCQLKFKSPTEYILSIMYELMFRFALAAGKEVETQTFIAKRTAPALIYQVDPAYLAASLVAMACGIAFLGALIWNWRLIGRSVTLSPLETTAALGRPILENRPHATIHEILTEVGRAGYKPSCTGAGTTGGSTGSVLDSNVLIVVSGEKPAQEAARL
ncbi:hypothetical protein V8F20_008859 [Naviculisporaceae sp. PSN 640]